MNEKNSNEIKYNLKIHSDKKNNLQLKIKYNYMFPKFDSSLLVY